MERAEWEVELAKPLGSEDACSPTTRNDAHWTRGCGQTTDATRAINSTIEPLAAAMLLNLKRNWSNASLAQSGSEAHTQDADSSQGSPKSPTHEGKEHTCSAKPDPLLNVIDNAVVPWRTVWKKSVRLEGSHERSYPPAAAAVWQEAVRLDRRHQRSQPTAAAKKRAAPESADEEKQQHQKRRAVGGVRWRPLLSTDGKLLDMRRSPESSSFADTAAQPEGLLAAWPLTRAAPGSVMSLMSLSHGACHVAKQGDGALRWHTLVTDNGELVDMRRRQVQPSSPALPTRVAPWPLPLLPATCIPDRRGAVTMAIPFPPEMMWNGPQLSFWTN